MGGDGGDKQGGHGGGPARGGQRRGRGAGGRGGPPRRGQGDEVRLRALQALVSIDAGHSSSQSAIRRALAGSESWQRPESAQPEPQTRAPLQGPDRGLVTALIYGVLRRQRPLDRWIAAASDRGQVGLDEDVLAALRLGAFQLAFMERVPAFAAIDAVVEAVRAGGGEKKTGFVNGILRRLQRERPWQSGGAAPSDDLPPWIAARIARFAAQVDQPPDAMIAAFADEAPLHLHALPHHRVRTLAELAAAGVAVRSVLDVPGVVQAEGGDVFTTEAFAQRRVLARDGASAAVVEWAGVSPGDRVLDIAAGRGAKSVYFAAAGAQVTAVDVQEDKLIEARALAERAAAPLAATLTADATEPLDLPPASFDLVLLDAPCTGLGTLRRRPEIRHRRMAADILRMAELQRRMLDQAATMVRPGGTLVFATCSFAEEEGPALIASFLADHPEFARAPVQASWAAPLTDARGDLRTHPLLGGMDAFFAARMRHRSA